MGGFPGDRPGPARPRGRGIRLSGPALNRETPHPPPRQPDDDPVGVCDT